MLSFGRVLSSAKIGEPTELVVSHGHVGSSPLSEERPSHGHAARAAAAASWQKEKSRETKRVGGLGKTPTRRSGGKKGTPHRTQTETDRPPQVSAPVRLHKTKTAHRGHLFSAALKRGGRNGGGFARSW